MNICSSIHPVYVEAHLRTAINLVDLKGFKSVRNKRKKIVFVKYLNKKQKNTENLKLPCEKLLQNPFVNLMFTQHKLTSFVDTNTPLIIMKKCAWHFGEHLKGPISCYLFEILSVLKF